MASSERTVLIAENPRAGAADAGRLLDQLVRGLAERGFRVIRECDPETIKITEIVRELNAERREQGLIEP